MVLIMHLPDGIIPFEQSVVYWIITVLILVIFYYYYSKQENKEKNIVSIAIYAVFVTVLSSVSIPSPLGVPIHFFIIPLTVILIGPINAGFVSLISLIFQSMILNMGGIVCFGANFIVMGFVIAVVTHITYKIFANINDNYAIFLSTVMGIMSATLTQVLILLLSGTMTLNSLLITLVPFYMFISIIEAFANVIIINALMHVKPELREIQKF